MMIGSFKNYLKIGKVKRKTPDINEAKALFEQSQDRLFYVREKKFKVKTAKFVLEDAYEAMREAAQSLMSIKGFKPYSHEATISFVKEFYKLEFNDEEINKLDYFRQLRNDSVYKAVEIEVAEAKDSLLFATKFVKKVKSLQGKMNNIPGKMEYDKETMDELYDLIKKGNVLDLGCGKGNEALFLASKGFDVTAIDVSKKIINELKEKAKKLKLKIKATVGNMEDFKFTENYNVILAIASLHFLYKKDGLKLLEKMKSHTNIGGVNLIINFTDKDPTLEDEEDCYFKEGELKEIYADWEIVTYEEYDEYDAEEEHTNKMAYFLAKKK